MDNGQWTMDNETGKWKMENKQQTERQTCERQTDRQKEIKKERQTESPYREYFVPNKNFDELILTWSKADKSQRLGGQYCPPPRAPRPDVNLKAQA